MCPSLNDPQNGAVSIFSTKFKGKAVFMCDEGFKLVGDEELFCEDTETWSDKPPTCEGETHFFSHFVDEEL